MEIGKNTTRAPVIFQVAQSMETSVSLKKKISKKKDDSLEFRLHMQQLVCTNMEPLESNVRLKKRSYEGKGDTTSPQHEAGQMLPHKANIKSLYKILHTFLDIHLKKMLSGWNRGQTLG